MKNFTNNFKQFTSRLSARWLIMALMMLVGTSSAWADYYITGNVIGNWYEGPNNRLKMTTHESDVVKAEVSKGGDFKIHYDATGWDVNWYKTIKKGTSTGATITGNDNGSNLNLSLQSGYSYPVTIYFDPYGDDGSPYVWAIATTGGSGGDGTKIQLAGSFNDWGSSTDYCVSTNNSTCSFEKELAANDKYEFKIVIDGVWYSGSAVTVDGDKIQFQNSWNDNSSFTASNDGIYTFNVDKDKKVWITYRTACTTPDAPSIEINNESSVTLCEGSATITVDGYSSTNTYTLYKGDETVQNPTFSNGTFTVSEADTYYVTVTTCAESPKQTTGVTLSYYSAPTLTDKYSVTNATKCNNTPNNDGAISIQNGVFGVTYSLNDDEGTSWSGLAKGTYTLKATLDACNNLSDTETVEVGETDKTPAINDISIKEVSAVCKGDNLTLQLEEAVQDGVTYTWYKSNTSSSSIGTGTSLVLTDLQETSTYILVASKTENGCTATKEASIEVTVYAIPTAPFGGVAKSETICADDYTFSSDYIWYTSTDGNGTVSGSTNLSETTTYYISKKVNNCESARTAYTVNVDQPLVAPTLTYTNPTTCNGNPTAGSIVIENYANYSNDISFVLYKGENPTEITYNNGFAISEGGDYKVVMTTSASNVCGQSVETEPIKVTVQDNTPTITNAAITAGKDAVCVNTGTTLTASATIDKGTLSYLWNTNATTASIETGNLTETTTYTVSITATNNGCPVTTDVSKTITVNPLSAPTISASANSGVNAIDLTINVQNAGCAPNYTLGYRIKQSDDLEYSENHNVATDCSTDQLTATIEGLVTGVEYMIQAYIINGYNNDEVFYTAPITCTVLASENCDAPSANYVEVLANNDEALQLYAWVEGKGTTPLGGWPGATRDTWYEVNSTGYSVWKIETLAPVFIIFNKGDNSKTADIKGPNNEGLKPGYRYIYDVNLNTWNYTLQGPTLIAAPEVETISATPERINETKSNVTLVGRIIKRGCADIRSYGFQYKLIDAKDYTNLEVGTGDIEPGSTFTGSLELGVGTYYLRARVENENGSKAYGDVIRVTIADRDLTIAAIDDDISVDTDTYYDFVGLYMSSITKPTTVDILSYTWYKDGSIYNPSIAESDKYGGKTYINTNGSNNIRPNQIGDYQLKVLLANGTTLESNVIKVNKASAVSASSILNASNRTLPVISVRTNEDFPKCSSGSYPSAQADKLKKKRSVDVKIFDKEGKLYYDRKARMNYRGSSSLNFVKKSYAFCPGGDMCGDVEKGLDYVITEKVNMFNLGAKDKDWVLYAAAADPSMMRNRIVFDTYAAMTNKWGVKSMFVELVVDGEYKGVYVFMDKITKNKDRVNITAVDGFIVKFDKTDVADRVEKDGDQKTFATTRTGTKNSSGGIDSYGTKIDQRFEIEYPEKDDNKDTWNNIVASIKDKFEAFETALADGNYSKVREIIDYDSWADWFIINEYIKNQDAYRASCIFVYNGEKIEARPLWDQELSMNNTSHTSHNCDDTNSLLITTASIYGDDFPAPFWFTGHDGASIEGGLLKDGCFISLVQKKLADYLKEGAALYAGEDVKDKRGPILKLAHDFNEELVSKTEGQTSAQEREDKFWEGKSRSSAECGGTHSYSQSSYSNEYGNVKNWILGDRDENLTSILGGMSGEMSAGISITTSPANAIVTPWIPITVTVNVAGGAEYFYDDTSITNGIALDVDKAITSKSGNKYTYTFPRPADWGNDNVDAAIQQIVYPITAKLKVYDTVCPGINNETGVYIKLQDEGNDICGELVDQ